MNTTYQADLDTEPAVNPEPRRRGADTAMLLNLESTTRFKMVEAVEIAEEPFEQVTVREWNRRVPPPSNGGRTAFVLTTVALSLALSWALINRLFGS